jgi:peptidoglycan-associated lipoprotein
MLRFASSHDHLRPRETEPSMQSRFLRHGKAVLLTVGLALSLAACSMSDQIVKANPDATDAPVGGGVNVPDGSNEDFIVNVGRRVYFREGSSELDDTAKVTVQNQAQWLVQYPKWKVKVQGFADDPGTPAQNVALALKRAEATKAALVQGGVGADRLRVKSYGKERLVRDCADLSCKSQNRRVITNLEGDEDL